MILAACGGGQVEAPQVDVAPTAAPTNHGPKLSTSQELGSIDEGATKKVWDRLSSKFQSCQTQGLGRIDYLSGDVKFFLRIGQDGHVKYAYLEKSSLGDVETEKCLLDAATNASWPQPEGGEAEVRYDGLGFDPPPNQRMPAEWNSDKIAATLGKHGDALNKCVEESNGAKFSVTAYVEPGGKVQSVGVATTSKEGAAKIDCIVTAVKAMKMPSPGSWAAKVAFQL